MVPTRRNINTEFLKQSSRRVCFDVSSSENNNIQAVKKVHYETTLRKQFQDNYQIKKADDDDRGGGGSGRKSHQSRVPLIHFDWACKIEALRPKFYPDYETIKKGGLGRIRKLIQEKLSYILVHAYTWPVLIRLRLARNFTDICFLSPCPFQVPIFGLSDTSSRPCRAQKYHSTIHSTAIRAPSTSKVQSASHSRTKATNLRWSIVDRSVTPPAMARKSIPMCTYLMSTRSRFFTMRISTRWRWSRWRSMTSRPCALVQAVNRWFVAQ